jgi:hypothetical protein
MRQPRPITFRCEYCSTEVTELHIPGNPPRYCAGCKVEAKRTMAKMRVRAMRERQAAADPFGIARQAKRRRPNGSS